MEVLDLDGLVRPKGQVPDAPAKRQAPDTGVRGPASYDLLLRDASVHGRVGAPARPSPAAPGAQ
ncbi:hypothetical protein GCM10010129_56380 [Streptomyces fumigatiscleroticus]|nr:hypothetical protein GCM10010129_56380 [Streptomyces fumigatiscleroticus]